MRLVPKANRSRHLSLVSTYLTHHGFSLRWSSHPAGYLLPPPPFGLLCLDGLVACPALLLAEPMLSGGRVLGTRYLDSPCGQHGTGWGLSSLRSVHLVVLGPSGYFVVVWAACCFTFLAVQCSRYCGHVFLACSHFLLAAIFWLTNLLRMYCVRQ